MSVTVIIRTGASELSSLRAAVQGLIPPVIFYLADFSYQEEGGGKEGETALVAADPGLNWFKPR